VKIVTIVGARPQFVKAAVVSRVIKAQSQEHAASGSIREILVHTGQHFDDNMSEVFFREMEIPRPAINLNISGGSHGRMTGRMLEAIESVLLDEKPDWLLVYGDTNSTLAGALAAAKLGIPIAHVEAGLRSFNRAMPEELNRILTDHAAELLFAPTQVAVDHLRHEGIDESRIERVGDVMFDAVLHYRDRAMQQSRILQNTSLEPRSFVLATVHRAENTDSPARLQGIIDGLSRVAEQHTVVLPLHPRTRQVLERQGLLDRAAATLTLIDPVGYFDMLQLEAAASVIASDSGGVQKEAYFHGVPCVTLRDETEWTELVDAGANTLVGADAQRIEQAITQAWGQTIGEVQLYGDGHAGQQIIERLLATPALA
jgi:UDP-GlcNAc3NAcA epimerase